MLHFIMNHNGDARGTFLDVDDKLAHAISMAEEALQAAGVSVLHGRNYQTSDDPAGARLRDLQRVRAAWAGLSHLRRFQTELRARIAWHERGR